MALRATSSSATRLASSSSRPFIFLVFSPFIVSPSLVPRLVRSRAGRASFSPRLRPLSSPPVPL